MFIANIKDNTILMFLTAIASLIIMIANSRTEKIEFNVILSIIVVIALLSL